MHISSCDITTAILKQKASLAGWEAEIEVLTDTGQVAKTSINVSDKVYFLKMNTNQNYQILQIIVDFK